MWRCGRAKIEDTLIEDVASAMDEGASTVIESTALEGYEQLIQKFCVDEKTNMGYVSIWLHYLTFLTEESCTRDVDFCRKVYKRAVSLTTSTIMQSQQTSQLHKSFLSYGVNASPGDLLYTHWQTFETRYGGAKDVLNVLSRFRKYKLKLASALSSGLNDQKREKPLQLSKKRAAEKEASSDGLVLKSKRVKSIDTLSHMDTTLRAAAVAPTSVVVSSSSSLPADATSTTSTIDGSVVAKVDSREIGKETRRGEEKAKAKAVVASNIIPGKFSLFIKNLDFSVTQEDLENVFSGVKNSSSSSGGSSGSSLSVTVRLTKSAAGKSRGMAHVDFPSLAMVEQAMHLHNTMLKGRPMTVERYLPSAYATADFHPMTVFVNHMSRNTSEQELKVFLKELLRSEGGEGGGGGGDDNNSADAIFSAVKIMKCKRSGNSKVRKRMLSYFINTNNFLCSRETHTHTVFVITQLVCLCLLL
jgi:RNA recognition motif-containing protein